MASPVSPAAITASRTTSPMASETKTDWSKSGVIVMPLGEAARMSGRAAFTALTTSSVEAEPFLSTCNSTECLASARTMLVCGGEPSRTWATSRSSTGWSFTTLTGMRLS